MQLFDTNSGLSQAAENITHISALGLEASELPSQNEKTDLVISPLIEITTALVQEQ